MAKAKRAPSKRVRGKRLYGNPGAKAGAPQAGMDRLEQLKEHFTRSGILFLPSQDHVSRRLRTLMGSKRAAAWEQANEERLYGLYEGCVYDLCTTPEELNALCSLQAGLALHIAHWIDRQVEASLVAGARIADLGCGTGALAGWLAVRHPRSEVVAYDAHPGMLAASRTLHAAPNLSVRAWDYHSSPPDAPGSCDVLVCSLGIDWPQRLLVDPGEGGPSGPRPSEAYQRAKAWNLPIFRNWRQLATSSGVLHAVLRIPHETAFFAAVDAAHEAGWVFESATRDSVRQENEILPALTFRAGPTCGALLPDEVVRGAWLVHGLEDQLARPFKGDVARALYESFEGKCVVDQDSLVDASGAPERIHVDHAIVGHLRDFAFAYIHCSCPGYSLRLLPRAEALRIKARDFLPGGKDRQRLLS